LPGKPGELPQPVKPQTLHRPEADVQQTSLTSLLTSSSLLKSKHGQTRSRSDDSGLSPRTDATEDTSSAAIADSARFLKTDSVLQRGVHAAGSRMFKGPDLAAERIEHPALGVREWTRTIDRAGCRGRARPACA
jgi:hypothetical protein